MTAPSTSWARTPDDGSVVALPGVQHARFDRQPPQDLAAEESVLGGMLLSKDAIADVVESLRVG
ncbi:MAG: hypothetical protein M3Z66_05985, partial [Chloroflexota bacterium]|nr:hypothetical protein [Chloroflexota bacterium]